MSEPKPFASLSSGLLARKGTAKPAMRPQGLGQFSSGIEDLGWNDMGHNAPAKAPAVSPFEAPHEEHAPSPIAALTPMGSGVGEAEAYEPAPPIVEQQRAAIQASFGDPNLAEPAEERSVLSTKARKVTQEEEPEIESEAEIEASAEPEAIIAEEEEAPVAAAPTSAQPKAEAGAKAKAAFTLRLEAERHLKLRLACAVTGRSAQQLVTEALDQLLQSRPEIGALAERVPENARK